MGTTKNIDSSAAFLFDVPGSNSPFMVQERQIGGTESPEKQSSERIVGNVHETHHLHRGSATAP
jgi:hypothetical protein